MKNGIIHRCPKECPWNKNCYVCKTDGMVHEDVVILHKCSVTKEDIEVHLNDSRTVKCVR